MNIKILLALGLATSAGAHATLIGTAVTGSVQFGIGSPNYFDPVHGKAWSGALNSTVGTTVTVSASGIEFGVQDGPFTLLKADFNANQLLVSENSFLGGVGIRMTFKDAAFIGSAVTEVSDSFASSGATATLLGDTLTVNLPELRQGGTFSALFNIIGGGTNVPDGGATVGMIAVGIAGLLTLRKRGQPLG